MRGQVQNVEMEIDLGLTRIEEITMDVVVSVFAVAVALSCLVTLAIAEIRDYKNQYVADREREREDR